MLIKEKAPIKQQILLGLFICGAISSVVWPDMNWVVGSPDFATPNAQGVKAQIQSFQQSAATPQNLLAFSISSHQTHWASDSENVIDLASNSGIPAPVTRPHPPTTPIPLMDIKNVSQQRLDDSTCQGRSAEQILSTANSPADAKVVTQVISKMNQWFPGWSDALLQRHVTIVIADHMPVSGQACKVGDGDQSLILIDRGSMNSSNLGAVVWLAQALAHEANHIMDAPWTRACLTASSNEDCAAIGRKDETLCLMKNAETLRAASDDNAFSRQSEQLRSAANQQQFYAEQFGRTSIPFDEVFDAKRYGWTLSAYSKAIHSLPMYGLPVDSDGKVTMISSRREAPTPDAYSDAIYTFEFSLPDGTHHVSFQFHLDETSPALNS